MNTEGDSERRVSEDISDKAQESAIETVEAIKERLGITWSPDDRPEGEETEDNVTVSQPETDENPAIDPAIVGRLMEAPAESMVSTPSEVPDPPTPPRPIDPTGHASPSEPAEVTDRARSSEPAEVTDRARSADATDVIDLTEPVEPVAWSEPDGTRVAHEPAEYAPHAEATDVVDLTEPVEAMSTAAPTDHPGAEYDPHGGFSESADHPEDDYAVPGHAGDYHEAAPIPPMPDEATSHIVGEEYALASTEVQDADAYAAPAPPVIAADQATAVYQAAQPPADATSPIEFQPTPIDATQVSPTADMRAAPPILDEAEGEMEAARTRGAAGFVSGLLGPLVFAGASIGIWWAITAGSDPLVEPINWPTIGDTVREWRDASTEVDFWQDIGATLLRIGIASVIGAVGGVAVGSLAGRFPILRNLLRPLTGAFRVVTPALLIPFFILWFGIGDPAAWLPAALGMFALTTWTMTSAADDYRRGLALNQGERALQAVRTGLAVAWPLVFAAEFFATRTGIGARLQQSVQFLDTPRMVVMLIVAVVLALAVDLLLRLLQFLLARQARNRLA